MSITNTQILPLGTYCEHPRIQTVMTEAASLAIEARQLRREIVEVLWGIGGGHYGGSLSVIDALLVLYRRRLRVAPREPSHPNRDRLILSKGHAAIALYALLRRLGYFDTPVAHYAAFESFLEGHPDMGCVPGVDFSTGSLGQGLSAGIGMAIAMRGTGQRTWVVLGDGECQEGQVWEAAMLASACRLDHIHAVVDCNGFQEWGWTRTANEPHPAPVSQMAAKWSAFGWEVFECDGHNYEELDETTARATTVVGKPSVVLLHTCKGKGVPLMENEPWRFHCTAVSATEHDVITESLA